MWLRTTLISLKNLAPMIQILPAKLHLLKVPPSPNTTKVGTKSFTHKLWGKYSCYIQTKENSSLLTKECVSELGTLLHSVLVLNTRPHHLKFLWKPSVCWFQIFSRVRQSGFKFQNIHSSSLCLRPLLKALMKSYENPKLPQSSPVRPHRSSWEIFRLFHHSYFPATSLCFLIYERNKHWLLPLFVQYSARCLDKWTFRGIWHYSSFSDSSSKGLCAL